MNSFNSRNCPQVVGPRNCVNLDLSVNARIFNPYYNRAGRLFPFGPQVLQGRLSEASPTISRKIMVGQ